MRSEIDKAGGTLHFELQTSSEGWFAECIEFPAIITGGTNKDPSAEEVAGRILDALRTAFHISSGEEGDKPSIKSLKSGRELVVGYS